MVPKNNDPHPTILQAENPMRTKQSRGSYFFLSYISNELFSIISKTVFFRKTVFVENSTSKLSTFLPFLHPYLPREVLFSLPEFQLSQRLSLNNLKQRILRSKMPFS